VYRSGRLQAGRVAEECEKTCQCRQSPGIPSELGLGGPGGALAGVGPRSVPSDLRGPSALKFRNSQEPVRGVPSVRGVRGLCHSTAPSPWAILGESAAESADFADSPAPDFKLRGERPR
jgi:hypothetical protein